MIWKNKWQSVYIFAITPSGVHMLDDNPHPSYEFLIPLILLVIGLVLFLVLWIGARVKSDNDVTSITKTNLAGSKNNVQKEYNRSVGYQSSIHPRRKPVDLFLYQAAEGGSTEAQYQLANWYYNESLSTNYANNNRQEAIKWYKKAAAQGHHASQEKLKKLTI